MITGCMIGERYDIVTPSKEYDLQEAIDYFCRRAEDYRRRRLLLQNSALGCSSATRR